MRRPAAVHIAVLALLVAMLVRGLLGIDALSGTFDETTHLPSGWSYLVTGDFRLNPQHPPLGKLIAALPLITLSPRLDTADPAWTASPPDEWSFGYRFLYRQDADRLLFRGRLPMVLLGLLLAAYVYRWSRDLFGIEAGLLSLALCAFSPTVLAHSRFVTFDVPLACFSTIATYHLWRYCSSRGRRDVILAGLALGAALATKFSGAVLALAVVPLVVLDAWRGEGAAAARWKRAAVTLVALAVLSLLVIEASYLFTRGPGAWWQGMLRVNLDHDPSYPYYLLGEFRPGGFWYYFLVAFAVKTPLPTLILLVAAILLVRRLPAPRALDEVFLVLPAVCWVVATSALADNLGVRYLMPVYPLVFVFVGRLAPWLLSRRVLRFAGAALLAWYAIGSLAIWPDELAYFNEAAGGPSNGHRLLDDSNIDWSQDLKRLARWLDRHGIERIKLRYGRNIAPPYYGIDAVPISDAEWAGKPPPGVYAFGTHLLIRGKLYEQRDPSLATDWLERYEPLARVGYSIWIFDFEGD